MRTSVVLRTGLLLASCLASGTSVESTDLESESGNLPRLMASDGRNLPFENRHQLLAYLETARIVSSKVLSQGITRAEKILLEEGGVTAHVVFHDVDQHEQRTKRLPNGNVVLYVKDSYKSQIAAYEMSLLLEMDSVPPTVARRFRSSRGSAQLWIENAMTEEERREKKLEPPDQNLWNQQYADMRVFDNLINNIDRNQGNVLIDPFWKLWMIDHTRSFGRDKSLPRPELVTRCSRRLWDRIRTLDAEMVDERLSPYLRKSEIKALLARREKLIALLEEKIASRGEHWVLFDPGAPDSDVEVHEVSDSTGSKVR